MLKWVRKRRASMNLSKKGAPPTQPLQIKQPPMENMKSNGSGPLPLSYPSEPPDDENMNEIVEENIEVHVMLPEGKIKNVSVKANIPMMDLLVNLAATSRLNPAGHSLLVLNEETGKLKDFKPNQTIGSLCTQSGDQFPKHVTVQLAPKKSEFKKSSSNTKSAQPFETTRRFTVNLPRSQKKVLRISPATTLEQVRQQISDEKHLDPNRYIFQLPGNPLQQLDIKMTVGELQTNEINFVSVVSIDSAKSMPDLSVNRSQSMKTEQPAPSYMPTTEVKKKKGFFSFLKKDKKFNVQTLQADINHGPPVQSKQQNGSGSPNVTRRRIEQNARPKTMYVTSPQQMLAQPKTAVTSTSALDLRSNESPRQPAGQQKSAITSASAIDLRNHESPTQSKSTTSLRTVKENLAPPPKTGKKRRAPPPPTQQKVPTNTLEVEVSVEPKQVTSTLKAEQRVPENVTLHANGPLAQKLHSRNSSDSSGYHELTLSGPESPETGKNNGNFGNVKLKTSIDTTSIDSGDNLNTDNIIQDISPTKRKQGVVAMDTGSSHTLPLDKHGRKEPVRSKSLERPPPNLKKKKAPPPPPGQAPIAPPINTAESLPPPLKSSETSVTPDKLPVATSSPRPPIVEKDDTLAIDDVLNDLDDHLDDDHQGMMMVENTDISVEEVEVDKRKINLRPCSFVAPPPPEEPPPDDSEPVSYSDIIGMRVDTVDIGTETSDDSASFEPSSTKSSPKPSSAIKVQDTKETEYKNEMAQFVERMSKMVQSNDKPPAVDEVTAESVPVVNAEYSVSEQTQQSSDNSDPIGQTISVDTVDSSSFKNTEDIETNSRNEEEDTTATPGDYEVSEITYNFTVDTVPPEFQECDKTDDKQDMENDKMEEVSDNVTETIHPFQSPVSKEKITSPISISDSPKDEVHAAVPVTIVPVSTTPVQLKVSAVSETKVKQETVQKVQKEVEKPKEEKKKEVKKQKDEFVLTFDDLQSVDYSAQKKKKVQVKTKPVAASEPVATKKSEPVTSPTSPVPVLDELKSRFKSEGEEIVLAIPLRESKKDRLTEKQPKPLNVSVPTGTKKSEPVTSPVIVLDELKSRFKTVGDDKVLVTPLKESSKKENVKDRCSELSFSPSTEGEVENVLEEKSIVMMALPAVRTSSDKLSENMSDNNKEETTPVVSEEVKITENTSDVEVDSVANDSKNESSEVPVALVTQYEQMQNQFLMWQQQLEQNQTTLASMNIPVDENSQQLQQQLQDQIQFQKQMMQQMQESMKALTVQNKVIQNGQEPAPEKSMEAKKEPEKSDTPAEEPEANASGKISTDNQKPQNTGGSGPKRKPSRKRDLEPKLDPREELMLSIRNFGSKSGLRKVKVTDTKWTTATPMPD